MPKRKVKRCVRPQCKQIYEETEKNRFCMCGALLQVTEIEIKPKKNVYKKPIKPAILPKEEGKSPEEEIEVSKTKALLYLLLEDEDIEFKLSDITRIGRASDGVQVDIDLTEYVGREVSREHAVIQKEKDGYYITNISRNHSVRIMNQDDNEVALEYGKKVRLNSEDGILLSKKVLLQFVEEE